MWVEINEISNSGESFLKRRALEKMLGFREGRLKSMRL
jgi:hypothetical protein